MFQLVILAATNTLILIAQSGLLVLGSTIQNSHAYIVYLGRHGGQWLYHIEK
jgi:hypothetical protein